MTTDKNAEILEELVNYLHGTLFLPQKMDIPEGLKDNEKMQVVDGYLKEMKFL